MKKKLNKPEIDGYRRGLPKPEKWAYTKSGGAIGDPSMQIAEEFIQSGSGVDESVECVDATPNEKFLNTNRERFNKKGMDDAPGRVVFDNNLSDIKDVNY